MEIPRSVRLQYWLVRRGLTQVAISKRMGVSKQAVFLMLNKDTIPTARHAQLVELGLPEELLPRAWDCPHGRISKNFLCENAQA